MRDVLTLILGGGRGTRLHPLTYLRSKPAVPIGGKYRLIDVPVSNCLHAGLNRIFVLTQFNSASLNRHITQTYRLDLFSGGFVDILAAEQTPDSADWFQGTADAVRQAARHFLGYDAELFLILAGDHLYRMDFTALVRAHAEAGADLTIAAHPVSARDATEMGIFVFDRTGRIAGFEEKPSPARLEELRSSVPPGAPEPRVAPDRPFVASMGIYLFSRAALVRALDQPGVDFGREIIPASIGRARIHVYLFDGYWADIGTIRSFYEAHRLLTSPSPPFSFADPHRPIYTRPRFLPAARFDDCRLSASLVAEGAWLERCTVDQSVVGIRTRIQAGARITRSVLLGADFYDEEAPGRLPLGIGPGAVLDRVIVDKNARIGEGACLTNAAGVREADAGAYCIRNGIIIVPKNAEIPPGTVV
jgi:glucose-1-phosphate adenylyltransferase